MSAAGASVPFMVTRAQKARLRARGLTDEAIAEMTPAAVQELLAIPVNCFTIITSSKPRYVGKTFSLGPNGALIKASAASISAGRAVTILMTPENLLSALQRTTASTNEVIALDSFIGCEPGAPAEINIVVENELERLTGCPVAAPGPNEPGFFIVGGKAYSARLKRLMQGSGWFLADADNAPGIPPHWAQLSLAERLEMLDPILPKISSCLRVEYRGSTSRVC